MCIFALMKREKKALSILIPTYNSCCVEQVKRLLELCLPCLSTFEIIVADDGSADPTPNQPINDLPHCSFIIKEKNEGSAATRNFLARQSQYEWLLFLDSDVSILHDDFISKYLSCESTADVINGGIAVGGFHPDNLRWRYEKQAEAAHRANGRQARPYHGFRSTNFLIHRDVMFRVPFDERFKGSGYEDVFFGKALEQAQVKVCHIDNPVTMTSYEENGQFMTKTERNMQTLHRFRQELQGYSDLITWSNRLIPKALWRGLFSMVQAPMHKHLCGPRPRLLLYNIYRLGYYLSIKA